VVGFCSASRAASEPFVSVVFSEVRAALPNQALHLTGAAFAVPRGIPPNSGPGR
jgi:hypothetical protein